jgi:kinesin family protein 4/21/27
LIIATERAEEQVKKFNTEIQSMKAQRVKLIRQMREENEKFRTWRQQKEREVSRLREQDRKRQGQIQKMEALHARQQHVLRRKMEEAVAVSKRLKEALNLQSTKNAIKSTSANSNENEQRIQSRKTFQFNLLLINLMNGCCS